MGQSHSSSKQNSECSCNCAGGSGSSSNANWEDQNVPGDEQHETDDETARNATPKKSSVDRYVSAVTERARRREGGRRRAWGGLRRRNTSNCICTNYRRMADSTPDTTNIAVRNVQSERCTNCNMCSDPRLAVLAVGMREIRKDLDDWLARISISTEYAAGTSGITGLGTIATAGSGETVGTSAGSIAPPLTSLGPTSSASGNVFLLSVTPHSSGSRLEDELEEARRALEATEPPLRGHFQVVSGSSLRAILLRAPANTNGQPPPARVHTQVDYIHCLVPDLQEITACAYYWGKMDRYEAERLLENKPEGTFLLRDSAQEEHLFSVSFRKYSRSLHARIEHYDRRFSFDSHDPAVYSASTVTQLIDHYKDPSCVMFFEPTLTCPLPRTFPFSLQQLTRAAIVSTTTYDGVDELPLPAPLRAYLKEYHYRQRVRVRTLDQGWVKTLDQRWPSCLKM